MVTSINKIKYSISIIKHLIRILPYPKNNVSIFAKKHTALITNNATSETCNETVFAAFFKSHAKPLRNFLTYKFGNSDQADDMTQDAFIKLWQNCSQVPLEKAKSYLYTIANNSTLNQIAHQKVVLNYEKSYSGTDTNIENPEFILEEKQFKSKLLSAIENLNETQRVAFLMHRIDGKKYSEIAEELNISVKAVEKRIHIALVELRKNINI
jgi:RNA polymerase sigma-70 factor (family 1)